MLNFSPYLEVYKLSCYVTICLFVAVAIFLLSYFLSPDVPDFEKLSPYECGFDPYGDARDKFDVHFYLVGLLFLLFDLETLFFLPLAVSAGTLVQSAFFVVSDFLLELLIGLYYVWAIGVLDWE